MLTLITGEPGAGKTALAVSMLMEEVGERPLFVMGIPELQIPHEMTPPVSEWTEHIPLPEDPTLTRPVFRFPPNSIVVIDEAQNVYRPRASTSKVPDYVAAIETHRHTGIDIWIITQGPWLIDSNLKSLVGRHVHIRAMPFGRRLYEWGECGDPKSKLSRDTAAQKRYKLPKKAFDKYKSASLHIKTSKKLPFPVIVFVASLLLLPILAWRGYHAIYDRTQPQMAAKGQTSSGHLDASAPTGGQQLLQVKPVTAQTLFEDENPRIGGRPETAPMYDGLRQVKAMPMAVAFVASKTKCKAYTQQGTEVLMSDQQCREGVERSRFNPYLDQSQPGQNQVMTVQADQAQQQQQGKGGSIHQGQELTDSNPKANMFDKMRPGQFAPKTDQTKNG